MPDNPFAGETRTVYELDTRDAEAFNRCKNRIHSICTEYLQRPVRVYTVHGHSYEGTIVNIDDHYAYLQMSPEHGRALLPGPYADSFYNPFYSNVILPLVLFDLLAISLIV
ncbi:hypothetical protein SAMN04487970_101472 [Paenibacillus tianmuensis]|uniref:Uncharacterized protein n=1 Tax=Paenibacillus tianmuensis TaxID=624147 RepID=A0A1G4REE7_9BACL|nr:hypothetical protein [Paenibacillus tianmuensis]SCW54569.1 hypothetical protein SAMN04487970_101472 [Paenibacillus tianmuensis]